MKHALAPVAALLIGVSILLTGQGLQGTLLPVRAGLEEFSTFSIGVMGGVYFFGFTLGCLKGGELLRNVGHVRVFAAMTAMASASPLVHSLVLNPWAWSLLRGVTGFCFAVLYIVIESWLNESASNEDRGTIFSTYVMITLTVTAVGQMMTLMYDPFDMHLFAITSVLVSIAAIPVALSQSASPAQPHLVEVDIPKLVRISPAGAFGCLAQGLVTGSFWALAPVFASSTGGGVSVAAWFMTAAVIGGAVAQWPLGFLSDKLGRRKVMAGICVAGTALGLVLVTVLYDSGTIGLSLFSAAWGFVTFPLYAIAVAHANDFAEPEDYVMVSSGLLLMYGAGAIVGPFLASALMTLTAESALYGFTGLVHAVLAVYVIARIFRRESTTEDHHLTIGDAITSAHTASHVYEEEIQQIAEDTESGAAG